MKVQVITRTGEECIRERKGDIFKIKRNTDPALHPFAEAREYTRALKAAKLDRMFAKPFVGVLSGHTDGVYCMARHPTDIKLVASGSATGEARLWSLASRQCIWKQTAAHAGFLRGLAFLQTNSDDEGEREARLLTCGDDRVVRLWDYRSKDMDALSLTHTTLPFSSTAPALPVASWTSKGTFTAIDSQYRQKGIFATSGSQEVAIWDVTRGEPLTTFSWGADTISATRFNQAERGLLGSLATDRSLMLHDLRTRTTIAKVVMRMRGNALSWNPQEAVYVSVASEDYNVYTFDVRYLERAVNVLSGHVSAVLDVDYHPAGHELVTAGYDRSLRLFGVKGGHSRDIYHTMRMQRLFAVRWSGDGKYVLSASDDGNVRIWKGQASEALGIKGHRERESLEYAARVLERHRQLPEVKRIVQHRNLPREIKTRQRQAHEHRQSQRRKEENRRKHSAPGTVPKSNVRDEAVLRRIE